MEYNKKHGIIPQTIKKDIYNVIEATKSADLGSPSFVAEDIVDYKVTDVQDIAKLTGYERDKLIRELDKDMKLAAKKLEFERAAMIRDLIIELKGEI